MIGKLRLFAQLQRGLLFRYGWLRSWWDGKPIDAQGRPLPWLTYPAIDFLSQFDFSNASVFEWGSGYSTLWWAERCRHITSVESNPAWAERMRALLPASVEFIETACDADAEIAPLADTYDVIVIDNHGPFRWRCAEEAAKHLIAGGLIILDNSDQCLRACEVLRSAGLVQIDFTGFAPSNGYAHTTSVFFRGALKFRAKPPRSVAQPNPPWGDC